MAAAVLIAHHFEQQQEQQQMNKLAADKEILMRQNELASEVKDNNNDDNHVANASSNNNDFAEDYGDDENKINDDEKQRQTRAQEKSGAQIMTKVDKRPPKLLSLSSLSTMMTFANEPVQANESQFVRTSCSPALKLNSGSQAAANNNHRKNILPNKLTLKSV